MNLAFIGDSLYLVDFILSLEETLGTILQDID